jgi:hypothetical protein
MLFDVSSLHPVYLVNLGLNLLLAWEINDDDDAQVVAQKCFADVHL